MQQLVGSPSVLYLFGLSGAGKSFVGEILSRRFGFFLYEAGIDLTPEMHAAIADRREFTDAMRDEFHEIIARRILELRDVHEKIAVTQASYKQRHRQLILDRVSDLEFIWVQASERQIADRLSMRSALLTHEMRNRGEDVTPAYAASFVKNFEPPPASWKVIDNNRDETHVVEQLVAFYGAAADAE